MGKEKIIAMPVFEDFTLTRECLDGNLPVFTVMRTLSNGLRAGLIKYRRPGIVDLVCENGEVLESMDFGQFLRGKAVKATDKNTAKQKAKIIKFHPKH